MNVQKLPIQKHMKLRLIRKWATAPHHAWLKSDRAWLDLFADLWAKMPEPATIKVLGSLTPLVVLPPPSMGQVTRIRGNAFFGLNIMQLDNHLLKRSRREQLAILAHELAHLCVAPSEDPLTNDLAADALAASWGFASDLIAALHSENPNEAQATRLAALEATTNSAAA